VKVTGEAVSVSKKVASFEKLMGTLIEKSLTVKQSPAALVTLRDFSGQFKIAVEQERMRFSDDIGPLGAFPESFPENLLSLLGLHMVARAQGLGFGAPITQIKEYCSCSEPGQLAEMNKAYTPPPVGSLYVTQAFLSSPLFYAYRGFRVGAMWLGTYSTVSTCMVQRGNHCNTVGVGNRVEIAGTD